MLIFYGLGNNEVKYLDTKHNIGRVVLENLAKKLNLNFTQKNGVFETVFEKDGVKIKMVYSTGFMNNSGVNFAQYLRYQNKKGEMIVVFQDDSDQMEGRIKFATKGGSAGHRGIDSLNRELGKNANFARIKMGIRPSLNRQKSETFVLKKMSKTDDLLVKKMVKIILESEFLTYFSQQKIDKITTLINSTKIGQEESFS